MKKSSLSVVKYVKTENWHFFKYLDCSLLTWVSVLKLCLFRLSFILSYFTANYQLVLDFLFFSSTLLHFCSHVRVESRFLFIYGTFHDNNGIILLSLVTKTKQLYSKETMVPVSELVFTVTNHFRTRVNFPWINWNARALKKHHLYVLC